MQLNLFYDDLEPASKVKAYTELTIKDFKFKQQQAMRAAGAAYYLPPGLHPPWVQINVPVEQEPVQGVVGEQVMWVSQSGSYRKEKKGVIIAEIHQGISPSTFISRYLETMHLRPAGSFGGTRKHISYLVRVGNKVYWPLVQYLRKA